MGFSSPTVDKDSAISIFDAISYDNIVDIKIISDFENLKNNRRFNDDQEASMIFEDKNGTQHNYTVDLSLRGRYRRVFSQGIPPLKIEFKKKDLEVNGFHKYDDLKLVTYFYEDKAQSKEILLKEYLAYKLYNAISGYSYRVQLVKLEIEDVNTGNKEKQMGFVIEDTDELRNRLGAHKVQDSLIVDSSSFHQIQSQIASMFQYMIGNSDWNTLPGKNIKLFEISDRIIMVPYDFDFSGLVNAPYAVPDNTKNIKSVRERVYLGFEDDLTKLEPVIKLFERKKDKLISIVNNTKDLSNKSKYEITEYLKSFYEDIEIRKKENISLTSTLPSS